MKDDSNDKEKERENKENGTRMPIIITSKGSLTIFQSKMKIYC